MPTMNFAYPQSPYKPENKLKRARLVAVLAQMIRKPSGGEIIYVQIMRVPVASKIRIGGKTILLNTATRSSKCVLFFINRFIIRLEIATSTNLSARKMMMTAMQTSILIRYLSQNASKFAGRLLKKSVIYFICQLSLSDLAVSFCRFKSGIKKLYVVKRVCKA